MESKAEMKSFKGRLCQPSGMVAGASCGKACGATIKRREPHAHTASTSLFIKFPLNKKANNPRRRAEKDNESAAIPELRFPRDLHSAPGIASAKEAAEPCTRTIGRFRPIFGGKTLPTKVIASRIFSKIFSTGSSFGANARRWEINSAPKLR